MSHVLYEGIPMSDPRSLLGRGASVPGRGGGTQPPGRGSTPIPGWVGTTVLGYPFPPARTGRVTPISWLGHWMRHPTGQGSMWYPPSQDGMGYPPLQDRLRLDWLCHGRYAYWSFPQEDCLVLFRAVCVSFHFGNNSQIRHYPPLLSDIVCEITTVNS